MKVWQREMAAAAARAGMKSNGGESVIINGVVKWRNENKIEMKII
jgi:hypothetical protein